MNDMNEKQIRIKNGIIELVKKEYGYCGVIDSGALVQINAGDDNGDFQIKLKAEFEAGD